MTLKGSVEVDGSSLRLLHVSPQNSWFAQHVCEWRRKHPGKRIPKYFVAHIRVCGAVERGLNGRVLVLPMPIVLLQPGSRPPAESVSDLRVANLANHLTGKKTTVFSDGAKAPVNFNLFSVGQHHTIVIVGFSTLLYSITFVSHHDSILHYNGVSELL